MFSISTYMNVRGNPIFEFQQHYRISCEIGGNKNNTFGARGFFEVPEMTNFELGKKIIIIVPPRERKAFQQMKS